MIRKVKKKKSGIRIFITFFLTVVIAVLVYKCIISPENNHIFEKEYGDKTLPYSSLKVAPDSSNERMVSVTPPIEPDPSVSITSIELNSSNAILVRLIDETVLMQKNSEEKIYPASLTKIMTAIVAIENLFDLKEEIKLTNSTFQGLYEADASLASFKPGEQVKAIDLLYGVLLPSGAECCIAIADQIAGSEQNFVKIMNKKASGLGMDNTHFENATGLHGENHYSTVKDLSILLRYALQNNTFREIFTSFSHFILPTNMHSEGITLYSTMFEDINNQSLIYGEILGGKTGYTNEAGLCLASLARVGKQEYILVSAGAKGNHHSEQYNITDALTVYNSLGKE